MEEEMKGFHVGDIGRQKCVCVCGGGLPHNSCFYTRK